MRWVRWGILLLAIFIISSIVWFNQSKNHNVSFSLVDLDSRDYIINPNVEIVPPLKQIAGPGTDGGGQLLYVVKIPTPSVVVANPHGYRKETKFLLLIPGRTYIFQLKKEAFAGR